LIERLAFADSSLDCSGQYPISLGNKCCDSTAPSPHRLDSRGSGCSAGTVQIINGVEREIKHANMVDFRHIQTTGGDIGTDQNSWSIKVVGRCGISEGLKIFGPVGAAQITVIAQTGNSRLGKRVLSCSGTGNSVTKHQS
jgi:hypothetical protein